ncbi:polymorphic toxin type 44 domain-containing protein [Marinomonas sp. THO17]|uniref:polymorphic toxin type 44 domain-containing protein n=1 Tax=Marinomonas sp. THO17 TaxID=3149048 RepID=UPI00336BC611
MPRIKESYPHAEVSGLVRTFLKQIGPFEHFGNFHYGAVGYAGGISENTLLRGAGCAQMRSGTSSESFGSCWGEEPYGDDPEDQYYISLGIEYAKSKGY